MSLDKLVGHGSAARPGKSRWTSTCTWRRISTSACSRTCTSIWSTRRIPGPGQVLQHRRQPEWSAGRQHALAGYAGDAPRNIPLTDVPAAVYANTLQLQFYFVPAGAQHVRPDGGQSTAQILGSSYLDLGRAVHYTQLPNLRLFAKAGFPFTRLADLSETAVLLPAGSGPEVMGLYLDLMGYFGRPNRLPGIPGAGSNFRRCREPGRQGSAGLGNLPRSGEYSRDHQHLPADLLCRSIFQPEPARSLGAYAGLAAAA